MEIVKTAGVNRATAGSWIRQALSCAVVLLVTGCGGSAKLYPAMTVTGISPTQGEAGTTVSITGAGLTYAKFVAVGQCPVPAWALQNDNLITFVLPSQATTGVITTSGSEDNVSSTQTFTVTPQVIGVQPLTGASGSVVVITGAGFVGTTQVAFGGAPAAVYTVLNANQINATVPAGAVTGPVQITAPGSAAVSGPTFTVTE